MRGGSKWKLGGPTRLEIFKKGKYRPNEVFKFRNYFWTSEVSFRRVVVFRLFSSDRHDDGSRQQATVSLAHARDAQIKAATQQTNNNNNNQQQREQQRATKTTKIRLDCGKSRPRNHITSSHITFIIQIIHNDISSTTIVINTISE